MQAIPFDAINQARTQAATSGRRVVDELEHALQLSPADFTRRLGAAFHYPLLTLTSMQALQPAFDILPYPDAVRRECIVFRDADGTLLLAIVDPFDAKPQAWAEQLSESPLACHLVAHGDMVAFLAGFEKSLSAVDGMLTEEDAGEAETRQAEELSIQTISGDSSPVVKLVNSTLYDALQAGASDIHLETGASGLTIKNRIDGVLVTIGTAPGIDMAEQALSRIKILAELDISERRVPQDGRFKVSIKGRNVDFRVSIIPTIFGEDAVLRILDKKSLSDELNGLTLAGLGYQGEMLAQMRKLAAEPYGMLLVTGPTGSGKTTTLYAVISEMNTGLDKIITIEDPVEYQLSRVMQIPVNEKKGLTFARGLRSILRHDPDKIMVGEIRDGETAEIAVQAALTGHLVFTTVHANNVFDVIGRFIHMGLDPYSFVSAMNGVIAQRLVRLNCPHCATDWQPDHAEVAAAGIDLRDAHQFRFMRGQGCSQCRGSGYKGRKAIAELLTLNDEIRELIVTRKPIRHLKEAALANGTRFLRDEALDLVRSGGTSLEEINRVTFVA